MLRGAIVGCGWIAHISHIPAFRKLKEVEIVAICDKREDMAQETARRFDIPRAYKDFSRMLKEVDLDFVDICSPPQTHFALSMQTMKAGLHVLVEKPMALNTTEAERLISTSKKKKIKLCVIHNFLFTPVVQKAISLVDSGAIGDLVSVEVKILGRRRGIISKQDHWCHSLPGGMFGEYGPHAVYLISEFFGHIKSVKAAARKHSSFPWVKADELKVLLEAEKGLGSFCISFNSPRVSFTIDIFGTKRSLHLDNFTMTMIQHNSGGYRIRDFVIDKLSSSVQLVNASVSSVIKTIFGHKWYKNGHYILIDQFITSMRNDMDPPITGEDGRQCLMVLEDIWNQIELME